MRRVIVLAIWLAFVGLAALVIARARFTADLSAFLPNHPTAEQAILIDQLRDGPASRLILVAIEQDAAAPVSDATLAALSKRSAAALRGDARFLSVNNGEPVGAARDRDILFSHRYLLSPATTPEHFTAHGLHAALEDSLDLLTSSAGLMLQPLLTRDPTAEMVRLVDGLASGNERHVVEGVWMSQDAAHRRALLVAETRAAGSDLDAQQAAVTAVRAAFGTARTALGATAAGTQVVVSGPGVFAASARRTIESEASRLSAIGAAIVAALLLAIYRSFRALALGLLPMLTGALVGIATVALGFGVVHGITLGFGVTLIGEAVDYAIYLFVQGQSSFKTSKMALTSPSPLRREGRELGREFERHAARLHSGIRLQADAHPARGGEMHASPRDQNAHPHPRIKSGAGSSPPPSRGREQSRGRGQTTTTFWPTIALGVATSVIGFSALMFSGFAGLAQIGLFSIAGLITAALVTRFVLPTLMPAGFAVRPMPGLGIALERIVRRAARARLIAVVLALAACAILLVHRERLWSGDLASLSPVSAADQATDTRLRSELGAPDVRDLIVIRAPDEERALIASERVVAAFAPLIADGTLAGIDAPSRYLPSLATQRARQAALPDDASLRANFEKAIVGLPFAHARFDEFFADVARQKQAPPLARGDLEGSSLALGVRALSMQHGRGWTALVALRTPITATRELPRERLRETLASLQGGTEGVDARLVDIKAESEQLYAGYLSQALKMSGFGALAITIMLAFVLRNVRRLVLVLAPLALAVLVVAALHVALSGPLTLFHLVGLLLIVAVGSNYALFFDRRNQSLPAAGDAAKARDASPQLPASWSVLASLLFANLTTAVGFGLLGFSSVPVLHAIGATVAPGAMLALIFSAILIGSSMQSADHIET